MKHVNKTFGALTSKIKQVGLAAALLLATFSFTTSQAQIMTQACLPDCPSTPFLGPNYVVLTLCGNPYLVEYGYRNACGIWYDYYIGDEIVPIGATTSSDFFNCVAASGGLNGFMQLVSEQLIIANPAGFPPNSQGCATNWRVLKGSCWRGDMNLEQGQVIDPFAQLIDKVVPCITSDCCLEAFTVCIQPDGSRSIVNTGYLPPQSPTCNSQTLPFLQGTIFECIPICGSIFN